MLTDTSLYLNTYKSKNDDEIIKAYAQWAPSYDKQMNALNWQAPKQIAGLLAAMFPLKSRADLHILDIGAGTGLVGLALQQENFLHIDAFDISSDMLRQAKAREVYKKIMIGNAERLSDLISSHYDVLVCVGALNYGHIGPEAFHEFIKAVRPGGYICFSTREDYFQEQCKAVQQQLEEQNKWRLITEKIQRAAIIDIPHRHWLYQVCH